MRRKLAIAVALAAFMLAPVSLASASQFGLNEPNETPPEQPSLPDCTFYRGVTTCVDVDIQSNTVAVDAGTIPCGTAGTIAAVADETTTVTTTTTGRHRGAPISNGAHLSTDVAVVTDVTTGDPYPAPGAECVEPEGPGGDEQCNANPNASTNACDKSENSNQDDNNEADNTGRP